MRLLGRMGLWLCIFFCFWSFSHEAWGSAYVLEKDTGRINWFSGLVSAQGQGFLPQGALSSEQAQKVALRQALIQARQNLWHTLQDLRIKQDLTLQERLQENTHLKSRVQGLVHNARILDKIKIRKEIVLVSIGVDLWGDFARLVIPDGVWFSESSLQDYSSEGNSLSFLQMQLLEARSQAYTGLVLEARGLEVEPALVCTVQDKQGNQVFGPAQVDPEQALQQGMALFVQSAGPKLDLDSRVGPNPLRIQVLQAGSQSGCSLVVDSSSGVLLRQIALQPNNFLQDCRVLIELDPPPNADLQEYKLLDR